ncbi:MAG: hypothetical protein A2041_02935 [Bacteroidetes bacterium GWA2_31_9b]|nr:MAG: hypothetical protein A2041_02935 [Bacteroidetes bacterium GWA2_31_9b]
MYKVFYNDRTVFFIDNFEKYFDNNEGLFYKYKDRVQLSYLLELFSSVKGFKNLYIFHEDIDFCFTEFCTLFTVIEAAGGLVKAPDNKILVINRRGFWDLPKGKLELQEKPERGAMREVEEECGLQNLRLSSLIETTFHTYTIEDKNILKKTYWYEMLHDGNQIPVPQLQEDITEAKWINKSNLSDVTKNTYLSIIEVLKKGKVI